MLRGLQEQQASCLKRRDQDVQVVLLWANVCTLGLFTESFDSQDLFFYELLCPDIRGNSKRTLKGLIIKAMIILVAHLWSRHGPSLCLSCTVLWLHLNPRAKHPWRSFQLPEEKGVVVLSRVLNRYCLSQKWYISLLSRAFIQGCRQDLRNTEIMTSKSIHS